MKTNFSSFVSDDSFKACFILVFFFLLLSFLAPISVFAEVASGDTTEASGSFPYTSCSAPESAEQQPLKPDSARKEDSVPDTSGEREKKPVEPEKTTDQSEENILPWNSVSFYTNQEQAALLEALKIVGSYSSLSNPTEQDTIAFEEAKKRLAPLNGSQMLNVIKDLTGDAMIEALNNIRSLGVILDKDDFHAVMPSMSLSVIMNFFRAFVPGNVFRRGLALSQILMLDNNRIMEPYANLVGTSKKRLYCGLDEVHRSGINFEQGRCNAPGAGRHTTAKAFIEYVEPLCLGAQIDVESIENRRRKTEIQGIIGQPVSANNNADGKKCNPGESTPDIQEHNDSQTVEDSEQAVADSLESSESAKPTSQTRLESAMKDFEFIRLWQHTLVDRLLFESSRLKCPGSKGDLFKNIAVFINSSVESISAVYADLRQAELESAFSDARFYDNPEAVIVDPDSTKRLLLREKYEWAFITIMSNAVQNLKCLFVSLIEEFEALWENASCYWADKIVRRACSFKKLDKLDRLLAELWNAYPDLIDRYEEAEAHTNSEGYIDVKVTEAHYKEVLEALETLQRVLVGVKGKNTSDILAVLSEYKEKLVSALENYDLANGDGHGEVIADLSIMIEAYRKTFQDALKMWTSHCSQHDSAKMIGNFLLYTRSRKILTGFYDEVMNVRKRSELQHMSVDNADENPSPDETGEILPSGTDSVHETESCCKEARTIAERLILDTQKAYKELKANLKAGLDNRKPRKNRKPDHINEASSFLDDIILQFDQRVALAESSNTIATWNAIATSARSLSSFLRNKLEKWDHSDAGYSVSYTVARMTSESILTKKSQIYIEKIWKAYESCSQKSVENNDERFVVIENIDEVGNWYKNEAHLSMTERIKLIQKFWNSGLDPTDIRIWIDYVISAESARTYGGPCASDGNKCCKITKVELKNAISFLTGFKCSENALWRIFTKDMGYSGHQCAKTEQIGDPNPLRYQQEEYIQKMLKQVNMDTTLCISIDAKAFVLLGRLKHDNGVLMCSPDGKIYRVADHDFGYLLREIYPNGTTLFGPERMDEKAVLHPLGVHCLNDKSGYVSLVIGKDTAESMCNLIKKVIEHKRKTMPNLKSILILADGGGSNMANGVAWLDNLLNLSSETLLHIDCCHFAPGCSRHNPVERELWRYISIHWKGRPLLDIEHVYRYVNETRLGPKGKYVTCWLDKTRYLTNEQKKKMGMSVLTRAQLNENAAGRITYAFPEGSDMHKWNYHIAPCVDSAKVP